MQNLISTFFPPQCLRCGRLEYDLCADCRLSVKAEPGASLTGIDSVFSAGNYSGWLRDCVLAYKSGKKSNAQGLVSVLLQILSAVQFSPDYLVGIPSTKTKVKSRGYDTVGHLCEIMSNRSNFKHAQVLKFGHQVSSQVGLTRSQRQQNLHDAFTVRMPISGKILLVDDVITTGATVSAAAQKLRIAGAKTIFAISLCRTQ